MSDFKEIKAKLKHYKPAIYDLGVCYFEGNGVKENKKKAFKCFLKSAKKFKYVSSYQKLAECYTYGYGCKINKEKAGEYKQKYNQHFKRIKEKIEHSPIKKDVHAKTELGDSPYQKFFKKHNILSCPDCQQEIKIIETNADGKLEDEYVRIWKGVTTEHDRVGYTFTLPNIKGETLTEKFQCVKCGCTFLKEINIKLNKDLKKETTIKTYTIKYFPIAQCNSIVEKILKESCGSFSENN